MGLKIGRKEKGCDYTSAHIMNVYWINEPGILAIKKTKRKAELVKFEYIGLFNVLSHYYEDTYKY